MQDPWETIWETSRATHGATGRLSTMLNSALNLATDGENPANRQRYDTFVSGDRTLIGYLAHDTLLETATRIVSDGFLAAHPADDGHYDGDLGFATAPKVVFFQATEKGMNQSMYPRQASAPRARFLVPPNSLGLHTNAWRMYFVNVTGSRGGQSVQLHVLFIPSTHSGISFCDDHFLNVNKRTFQPFRHTDRGWEVLDRNSARFQGRQLMVNVCIAGDIPIYMDDETSNLSLGSLHTPHFPRTALIRLPLSMQVTEACRYSHCTKDSCHRVHHSILDETLEPWVVKLYSSARTNTAHNAAKMHLLDLLRRLPRAFVRNWSCTICRIPPIGGPWGQGIILCQQCLQASGVAFPANVVIN